MVRKCHNHKQQTTPWHREEEPLNQNCFYLKIVNMVRKCHIHKQQTTPWHREEEPLNHYETPGRQIKQSNQLSLSSKTASNLLWNQIDENFKSYEWEH